MRYVDGIIYQESGFIKGHLGFEDGHITEIASGPCPDQNKVVAKGAVFPLLANCHTHIGDAIARGMRLPKSIRKLVSPPDGLKFRILRESKPEQLITAMRRAIIEMLDTGTQTFSDFREEGVEGVELLNQAVKDLPINTMIMGRPKELEYNKKELTELLPKVDGIGVSSMADWDFSELLKISKTARDKGKLFALHASERKKEKLDKILELKPDFLIHMTYGSESDYEKLAELQIPVVLCLRSNVFFNNIPKLDVMIKKGVILLLGSDNAMINSSNLFEELKLAFELANRFEKFTPKTLLNMITINPKKILNPKYYINLTPDTPSNFMVLDISFKSPELDLVKGISQKKIKIINIGDTTWETSG